MEIRKGKIRGFYGSWGSGVATLIIEDDELGDIQIFCENGQTVRSLESAFGNVIGPGHCINPKGGHMNKSIYWSYDEMDLMLGAFTPTKEARPELKALYKKQKAERGI